MSPLLIVLALACALLAVAAGALATALVALRRRSAEQQRGHDADLAAVREQLEELAVRQAEAETTSQPAPADYVITFDTDEPAPTQVSTQRVVSTALGEPLIKIAAFGHGLRHALREERRALVLHQVRREYRRRRKASRAAARAATRQAR